MTWEQKEIIGDCTLYLGDCMDVLPSLSPFDLLLTDPPYGINRSGQKGMKSSARGRINSRSQHADKGWDKARISAVSLRALTALARNSVVWGGNYYADILPPTSGWLVWDKGQRLSQSDGELAWTNRTGALRIIEINRAQIGVDSGWREPSFHPTQKPESLMSWCLSIFPEDNSVFDPFMGSGTTGVACAKYGKKFCGVEVDKGYFEIACERIRKAYDQPVMFPSKAHLSC